MDNGTRYMTGTGGEKLPAGIDPKSIMVERSVPVHAMTDALLAWEMNGAPISLAHGGLNAVKGVEVSIDGGKTWQAARLVGPDLGKYAWRQFVLQARLVSGNYTMASRATDSAGNVQPETRGENLSGNNNTSWADHAVNFMGRGFAIRFSSPCR
jgi:hypothetical protein